MYILTVLRMLLERKKRTKDTIPKGSQRIHSTDSVDKIKVIFTAKPGEYNTLFFS